MAKVERCWAAILALAATPALADHSTTEGTSCVTSAACGLLSCIDGRCRDATVLARRRTLSKTQAYDPLPARYIGASFAGFAGGGLEGRNVEAAGGDMFTGVRVSRWLSVEAFWVYDFQNGSSSGPATGAFCPLRQGTTWLGDSFHWQALGVRTWFHALHRRYIDVSFAAMVAGGFALDRTSFCSGPNMVVVNPVFETGTAVGVEVRPTASFGIRASIETLLDVGVSVAAVRVSIGPVFRF